MRDLQRRVLDLALVIPGLAIVGPLLLVCAALVRVTMGAPVFFHDVRAGRDGVPFPLVKFRTMRPLRPGETIPDDDAARITRVGAFLRSTSLDELPSLLNVLRGEMALVGPRPLPVRYVERYAPEQRRRLEVRPGITGWAQVHGRNQIGWTEKFELDVWYVDHRSVSLDVKILVDTVKQVLRREGVSADDHATMPEFLGSDGTDRSAAP
jgi:lipopolysaccharide/colanic/teichoic acid biosynthesis glycosyltransferase